MRSEILSDFTTDKTKTQEALDRLQIAAFSRSQPVRRHDRHGGPHERHRRPQGDPADRHRHRHVQQTHLRPDAQEAAGSRRADLRHRPDADSARTDGCLRRTWAPSQRMDFLQADNELRTFAKETGGAAFFPQVRGRIPGRSSSRCTRRCATSTSLTYSASNTKHDGTFRKIKVELVNPATNEPLPVKDEKGKPIKYQIIAKAGYKAPRAGGVGGRRDRRAARNRRSATACPHLSRTPSGDFPRRCKSVDSGVTALLLSHSFCNEDSRLFDPQHSSRR